MSGPPYRPGQQIQVANRVDRHDRPEWQPGLVIACEPLPADSVEATTHPWIVLAPTTGHGCVAVVRPAIDYPPVGGLHLDHLPAAFPIRGTELPDQPGKAIPPHRVGDAVELYVTHSRPPAPTRRWEPATVLACRPIDQLTDNESWLTVFLADGHLTVWAHGGPPDSGADAHLAELRGWPDTDIRPTSHATATGGSRE